MWMLTSIFLLNSMLAMLPSIDMNGSTTLLIVATISLFMIELEMQRIIQRSQWRDFYEKWERGKVRK